MRSRQVSISSGLIREPCTVFVKNQHKIDQTVYYFLKKLN